MIAMLMLAGACLLAWGLGRLALGLVDHPELEVPCGAPLALRPRQLLRRRAQRWAPSARSRAEARTAPLRSGVSTASTARPRMTIVSTVASSWARWAPRRRNANDLTIHLNPSQHPIHSMMTG